MSDVQVHDKHFSPYLSPEKIAERVKELGSLVSKDYEGRNPLLISILNGSFVFTADLMRAMSLDTEVQFVRVSSYGNEMKSGGKMRQLIGLDQSIEGQDILIIEDIVDTGNTLTWMRAYLADLKPASVQCVSLLFKKECFVSGEPPEYFGFEIPDKFVVGYGLDYAQKGRFLDSIYQLKS